MGGSPPRLDAPGDYVRVISRQTAGPLDPIIAKGRTLLCETLEPLVSDLPDAAPLLLIACSGGPDSLALAATAAFTAPRLGARVGAVIVDHGLQEGSAAAAETAAAECRKLGLDPVQISTIEVLAGRGSGGVEAAARRGRYRALEEVARSLDARAVLLGHTLDDQAEQVLLALARGSGTRSIAGIPASRGLFYRPFLQLRRSETVHICEVLGLKTWHDPTNEVPARRRGHAAASLMDIPRRTVVRDVLLPALEDHLGPGIAEALARTADLARADDAALTEIAGRVLQEVTVGPCEPGRRRSLDCAPLELSPSAIRSRVLRGACLELGVPGGALSRVHIDALDALVTNWHGQGPVDLPGSYRGERQYGTLNLYHRNQPAN